MISMTQDGRKIQVRNRRIQYMKEETFFLTTDYLQQQKIDLTMAEVAIFFAVKSLYDLR